MSAEQSTFMREKQKTDNLITKFCTFLLISAIVIFIILMLFKSCETKPVEPAIAAEVFLPTMWKMYPDKQDFLNRLCSDAQIQEASWRRTPLNISYFTAESFAEDDDADKK
jgi:uncharacterized membrane protein YkgB